MVCLFFVFAPIPDLSSFQSNDDDKPKFNAIQLLTQSLSLTNASHVLSFIRLIDAVDCIRLNGIEMKEIKF